MPQLELAGRPGKILSRFPTFMRAASPGKALGAVAVALGRELDEGERLAMRIQRAHRIDLAEEDADVFLLAALLDLQAADLFVLRALYGHGYFAQQVAAAAAAAASGGDGSPAELSDLEREQGGYDLYVSELRDSVERTVRVLFDGCGTIWSLLEGTAILLDADRLDGEGHPTAEATPIDHLDQGLPHGGFVHRMRIRHHVLADGAPAEADGALYMVENPIVERTTGTVQRRQRETFPVTRGGFFDGPVTISVTGVGGRTVKPLVIDRTSHHGVGYDGVLADGQTLVFATDGTVLLDGADVTARAFAFHGALATDPRPATDPPAAQQPDDSTFDGSRGAEGLDGFVVVEPEHAMDRRRPRPAVTPLDHLPVTTLAIGESRWRFSVEEGAYDASGFGEAVFALPSDPEALAALPPSGTVTLTWKENEPFAVSVLIPSELRSLEDGGLTDGDLPTLVRAGLERFRSAGVRLDVRYFDLDWILGSSVLESLDAPPGPGVDFDATVPGGPPPAPGEPPP